MASIRTFFDSRQPLSLLSLVRWLLGDILSFSLLLLGRGLVLQAGKVTLSKQDTDTWDWCDCNANTPLRVYDESGKTLGTFYKPGQHKVDAGAGATQLHWTCGSMTDRQTTDINCSSKSCPVTIDFSIEKKTFCDPFQGNSTGRIHWTNS